MNSNTNEKQQPVHEFRVGGVKAVIWKNQTRNGVMFSTSLVRIYKDAEDQWQETHSLGRDDLLAASKVLDQAHSYIIEEEQAERSENEAA